MLITLNEMKVAEGVDPADMTDAKRDAKWAQAILFASAAIDKYCDRGFSSSVITEQRQFEWDNSGFVDIDDATAIQDVIYSIGGYDTTVATNQWRAEPFAFPVFTYIVMPPISGMLFSPAMGFNQNLDVLYKERGFVGLGPTVKVDATWGWTTVPDDVKMAVVWTAAGMAADPNPYVSESIANYSHAIALRGPTVAEAIPERARDLLAPYVRYMAS